MHKLLKGACIALGLACFGASYYLYNNFINPPEIVEVTDNNYHMENTDDGSGTVKLVMVQGKIKPKENNGDSLTGLKVKYPVLQRKVEMYQYFLEGDKPMMGFKDRPIKSFKDSKGHEWSNPAFPSNIKTLTFYNDFVLGDGNLPVSSKYLERELDKEKYSKSFYYLKNLPKDANIKDFEWKGNQYVKPSKNKNRIGEVRIYYKVLNYAELPELTIIGQQKNGKVNRTNADCRFYDRPVTMEEIRKTYKDDAPHAALAAALFGAFFIVLGVFKGER